MFKERVFKERVSYNNKLKNASPMIINKADVCLRDASPMIVNKGDVCLPDASPMTSTIRDAGCFQRLWYQSLETFSGQHARCGYTRLLSCVIVRRG